MGKKIVAALAAMSLVTAAAAEDAAAPRTFIAHLYQKATRDRRFTYASPRLLTADLYDLAQRGTNDGKAAGPLGYDPVCQCRDSDGLSAQILSITVSGDRAVAQVMLRFDAPHPPPPQRVTLVLTRAPLVGWKIADIQTSRVPSLRAFLARRGGQRS